MRKILAITILALCFLAPVQRLDVAKLRPVQTVAVYRQGWQIVLETDAGDKGVGTIVKQALENLKENALKVIYLDTAEYLLVQEDAQDQVEHLRSVMNKKVKVGPYGGGDIAEETDFWEVHGELPKLEEWKPTS